MTRLLEALGEMDYSRPFPRPDTQRRQAPWEEKDAALPWLLVPLAISVPSWPSQSLGVPILPSSLLHPASCRMSETSELEGNYR
jgi:hypothetical protein